MTDVVLPPTVSEEGAALSPAPARRAEGEKQKPTRGPLLTLVDDRPTQSPVLAFSRIWELAALTQQTGKIGEKPRNVNLPEMLKQWSKKPSFKAVK